MAVNIGMHVVRFLVFTSGSSPVQVCCGQAQGEGLSLPPQGVGQHS